MLANTKYSYPKGQNCPHMECEVMHVFMCVAVHMQACICLFVCVCRSVKESTMAYKAHCVSTGDMWLGERASSKSLF